MDGAGFSLPGSFLGLALGRLLSLRGHKSQSCPWPQEPHSGLDPCLGLSPKLQTHTSNYLPATYPWMCQGQAWVNLSQMKHVISSPRPLTNNIHSQVLCQQSLWLVFCLQHPAKCLVHNRCWDITCQGFWDAPHKSSSHKPRPPQHFELCFVFTCLFFPLNNELPEGRSAPPASHMLPIRSRCSVTISK